jgi:hypothetical protein
VDIPAFRRRQAEERGRGRYLGVGLATFIEAAALGALGALPDVIVGHLRRYSPRATHDHENDGKSAGRMRA